MHLKCLSVSILFLLFACKPKTNPDRSQKTLLPDKKLYLTIEYAQSSKVELSNSIYTVFFMGPPPLEVKFKLTPAEKEGIVNLYYALSLDKLNKVDDITGTVYIEDECMIMPKINTYIMATSHNSTKRIEIDESCNNYSLLKRDEAKRVKEFLEYVDRIIQAKPEIKNAPHSDIIYL